MGCTPHHALLARQVAHAPVDLALLRRLAGGAQPPVGLLARQHVLKPRPRLRQLRVVAELDGLPHIRVDDVREQVRPVKLRGGAAQPLRVVYGLPEQLQQEGGGD